MSTYTDASLIVTPNAVKAGKLYALKGADLDVVRATSATRVDENGLIEIPATNLCLQSDMFANTTWVKDFLSISLNNQISPDGTLTADTFTADGTTAIHQMYQSGISITSGTTYTNSIFAKKGTNNFIQIGGSNIGFGLNSFANFDLNNGTIGTVGSSTTAKIENYGNGWYRCIVTFTAIGTTTLAPIIISLVNSSSAIKGQTNILNTSVYLWGAQVEQGITATEYIPTTTVVRTRFAGITQDGSSASNIPRLDYTNGSCPSILVEPQRTNLNLWSEDLTNTYWSKFQASITGNAAISPSGNLTADKIVENTTTNAHAVFIGTLSLSIGQSLTRSVYLKGDGRIWVALAISESGVFYRAYFNLSNGTIGNVVAGITASIEPAANGYYKCSITRVLANPTPTSFAVELASANGTNTYLGNGTSGVFVWGAQIEVGSNATSYIPTATTAVTRNADVISKSGLTGITTITETFENNTTNVITGSPTSYTMSQGRIKNVIGL